MMKRNLGLVALGILATQPAAGQVALDRADPTIIQRSVPQPPLVRNPAPITPPTTPPPPERAAPLSGVIRAVVVGGQRALPPASFAAAIAPVIGQELARGELARLAGAIADVARGQGYPFASAMIAPQSLGDGILRVTLDLGRIDAVRVIGARNAAADRILAHALVGSEGVRQDDLERALLLVGDLPGVRVKDSRYVRQNGFGILLVTIASDRAAAYVQLDNRGSDEVGPIRSTLLASVRNLAQAGDEIAVIASQTPLQLSEFAFLRARYTAPVDATGTVIAVSGSVARSKPGRALAPLHVLGRSADAALAVQRPLLRTRAQSLWAGMELRTLGTEQALAGRMLRRDRLTTLSGTLSGTTDLAGGALHGELVASTGLPFGGTREGAPLASRVDGDARFVSFGYAFDWAAQLSKPFSVVLASTGQVATRPLLATAEIGVGGPGFARAYDYAERTGDDGILGSAELRADLGRIAGSVVDRAQLYGFVDGGTVYNLRDGVGGGSLASTGAGARIGTGRFDWLVECAFPLTGDRFDTGDRRPRISLRVARAF